MAQNITSSSTRSETSVAANFEMGEMVTEASKVLVRIVAGPGMVCAAKNRGGQGVYAAEGVGVKAGAKVTFL